MKDVSIITTRASGPATKDSDQATRASTPFLEITGIMAIMATMGITAITAIMDTMDTMDIMDTTEDITDMGIIDTISHFDC